MPFLVTKLRGIINKYSLKQRLNHFQFASTEVHICFSKIPHKLNYYQITISSSVTEAKWVEASQTHDSSN